MSTRWQNVKEKSMSYVITIGRQHGCGGRVIGKDLADRLGIEYYDKNIIHQLIADDCGMDEEMVSEFMEKKGSSLLYEMASGFGKSNPLDEQVYISKTRIIKELADNHTCVIVGKCADYILRDYDNVLNVFLYADIQDRIDRIVSVYKDFPAITEKQLHKMDKQRANYYKFYTSRKWGDSSNYDIMINTSVGLDNVTSMLETIALGRFGGQK